MSGDAVEPASTGKGPARGYSWPPFQPGNAVGKQFQPGNDLSERHGAYSPRKVEPLAQAFVDLVVAQAAAPGTTVPWLADPTYRPELLALGRAEAQIQLLTEWLMDHDAPAGVDADGAVLGAANLLHRAEASATRLRSALGLSPLARARLGKDIAGAQLDMATLMAQAEAAEREASGG